MNILQFAVLGLGLGAIYGLLSNGLVLIYRGSGVLNFAQGAFAMVGAYAFWELHYNHGQSFVLAFVVAVVGVGIIGALSHLLIMRPLRHASSLVRLIATLGILALLQGLAVAIYQGNLQQVPVSLPHGHLQWGTISVPEDDLCILGIAVGIGVILYLVCRYTRFGLAISAVSENRRAASSLGWSPDLVATVTWLVGAALAAVAGILIVPYSGLDATQLTLVVIAALAAALAGGFSSFPISLIAGIGIGIVQSLMANYVTQTGASDAVPFIVIMIVLVIRGKSLPVRRDILDRLPRVGSGVLSYRLIIPLAVVLAVLMSTVFPTGLVVAVTIQLIVAVILLSVLTVTGYAGQLSLAQYGLAGTGAFFAGQLVSSEHWPFILALLAGIIGAAAVGAIFGIPALRTRGVNLAVVTLGLGFALQVMLFNNNSYTGGLAGMNVGAPSLFGLNIDPIAHPARYGIFVLVCLVLVFVGIANMRRGRAGRSFIAVRANERAAASLGISVVRTKLVAFSLASGIAGLGGVLLAFQSHIVIFSDFDIFSSINAVVYTTVGGIGFLAGPLLGSGLAVGGVGSWLLNMVSSLGAWLGVIGGASVLLTLLLNPDGIAGAVTEGRADPLTRRAIRFVRERLTPKPAPFVFLEADNGSAVLAHQPMALHVDSLTVQYGAVVAVDDLSLMVQPGEVLGLIGPNGAGKTTVIDAVTGFTKSRHGSVRLGDQNIGKMSPARRARLGLARSFQSVELFDDLTVLENLQAASDRRDALAYVSNLFRPGKINLPAAAVAAIREFSLADRLSAYPTKLSHGQRRLVGIARAMASQPSVLLLDEPAAGLDSRESVELGTLITRLAHQLNVAIILVEHDMSVVMSVCDRVAVLDFGHKIAEGTPAELRTNPAVIAAYLGEERSEDAAIRADDDHPANGVAGSPGLAAADPDVNRPVSTRSTDAGS